MNSTKTKPLFIGFLGLGNMGSSMVMNLLKFGHNVIVWNRTLDKCRPLEKAGATVALTPKDVVECVDITISCVSNQNAEKDIVYGENGIIASNGICGGKGYVSMTSKDDKTSNDINSEIQKKGGRYLVAMLQGSLQDAKDGTLILITSGDNSLYDDCHPCFKAISRSSFYLVGSCEKAATLYLSLQLIQGNLVAGLAEVMALARASGLELNDFLKVLQHSPMGSPFLIAKCRAMIMNDFSPSHPLQHVQRDMGLALRMAEHLRCPPTLYFTAAAHQMFIEGMRCGYGQADSSALHVLTLKRPSTSIEKVSLQTPAPVRIAQCQRRQSTRLQRPPSRYKPAAAFKKNTEGVRRGHGKQNKNKSALHVQNSKRLLLSENVTNRILTPKRIAQFQRRLSTLIKQRPAQYQT